MPMKDSKSSIQVMQGNVLYIYPKYAKHITNFRGMSVFECPGDSLDFKPIQDDWNIMKMSWER